MESGRSHPSSSEVVREALRRDIQQGIDSGEPVDGEAMFDRLLAKYEAMAAERGG